MTGAQNTWQALKLKDAVHSGDVIQTAMEKGTFVDIAAPPSRASFGSGTLIREDVAPIPPNGWDRRLWSTPPPFAFSSVVNCGYGQEVPKGIQLLIRLYDNSILKFEELAQAKSPNTGKSDFMLRLDLQRGQAVFRPNSATGTADCQVRFTNCVAKIRGGTCDIRDGKLRITKGTVSVTQGSGQAIEVPDGYSFSAETGAVEPIPSPVLRD